MPPIKHNGEIVGYYAQSDSAESQEHAGNPELRPLFAQTEDGDYLDFTLFVPTDGVAHPAAGRFLEMEGITNVMVNFIRPDASLTESGSYAAKLYRGKNGN